MRTQTKGQDRKILKSEYRSLKRLFRYFFEGYDIFDGHHSEPQVDIPISQFGITNLEFNETKKGTEFTITLDRPGILIGKAGQTLYKIQNYLSEHHTRQVKILIIESTIWRD